MLSSLFKQSSIPLLEQVVNFTEARHGVLAGNIANLDTPGYKTRDLSPELFQEKLKEAVVASKKPAPQTYGYGNYPNYATPPTPGAVGRVDHNLDAFAEVKRSYDAILRHDGVNVSMENQINQIVKNQTEHNMAIGIMTSQFRLLRAAISERAV
jgi:flagellar basal-body rod protein FlgB